MVLPGALATHMVQLIPGIQFSLCSNQNHSNRVPAIISVVSDSFYKISSETLVVLQRLVKVLRPLDSSPTTFDFTLYTNKIYQCCFVRLKVRSD